MADPRNNPVASYSANPNQKVYDQEHKKDHVVELKRIYFGEKVPQYEWVHKEIKHIAKKGEEIQKIKAAELKKLTAAKKKIQNFTADPDHDKPLATKEQVKIFWEEEAQAIGKEGDDKGKPLFRYNEITKAKLKGKVYVAVVFEGESGKITIKINENKLTNAESIYENPVKFLIEDKEESKIEISVKRSMTYAVEIALRPKSDDDLKKLIEKYVKRADKNAFLYFTGEITDTQDKKIPETLTDFLNGDGEQLRVRYCNCGEKYKDSIECTRYGTNYGPVYWGELPLKDFPKWDKLVTDKSVTEDEKSILIAMSENEGKMDAVQAYDSEILTGGAMQKTINPEGYGELPVQFWEFKEAFPDKYTSYLEDCGWEVEREATEKKDKQGNIISTTYKYKAKYKNLTGTQLKSKIREGFSKSNFKSKVKCEPFEPIINLLKDQDYQIKQITDFVKRLNKAIAKTPTGYTTAISGIIKSNLGKAVVLDNDVNRPGEVADCFGQALDSFFLANKKVSKNFSEWGENYAKYEKAILEIYGPLRGTGSYTMTDASGRYTSLKSKL